MNIYLTGYRCTGKTSVGKSLAKAIGWTVVDADTMLVNEYDMTITDIVSSQGWEAFRSMEKEILKKLCARDRHVVATGGGVILDKDNVRRMRDSGTVIWLRADPETIKERIVRDQTTEEFRPSLTSKGLMEEIEETLSDRNPLYEESMDFAVDTDRLSIDDVCLEVIKRLKADGAGIEIKE